MQKIRWGIIGCGDVTERKSGPAFNKAENSELVAVMRRDAKKAEDYARRHKVPKWYDNADELINDSDVNAIYVATPPSSHEQYALAAIKAGKPVYVEKPFTLSAESAINMAAAAEESGVKMVAAHYRRALPMFKEIKEILLSGIIGDIRLVNLSFLQPLNSAMITKTHDNWRVNPAVSGGGLFHDMAPHQLDILMWMLGDVAYSGGVAVNQGGFYPADDLVAGQVIFTSGVVLSGSWCFTVAEKQANDWVEIYGSAGSIGFPVFGNFYEINEKQHSRVFRFTHPENIQLPMIQDVVNYFRGEGPNPCTATDAVKVMHMIDSFILKK